MNVDTKPFSLVGTIKYLPDEGMMKKVLLKEKEEFAEWGYKGPGWYFYDETFTHMIGPHASEEDAQEACKTYAANLQKPDAAQEGNIRMKSPAEWAQQWPPVYELDKWLPFISSIQADARKEPIELIKDILAILDLAGINLRGKWVERILSVGVEAPKPDDSTIEVKDKNPGNLKLQADYLRLVSLATGLAKVVDWFSYYRSADEPKPVMSIRELLDRCKEMGIEYEDPERKPASNG